MSDDADDPEILLIAWRGRASALAARLGTPPKNLIHELVQLGASKKGGTICMCVDFSTAPGRLHTLIRRRHAQLVSE